MIDLFDSGSVRVFLSERNLKLDPSTMGALAAYWENEGDKLDEINAKSLQRLSDAAIDPSKRPSYDRHKGLVKYITESHDIKYIRDREQRAEDFHAAARAAARVMDLIGKADWHAYRQSLIDATAVWPLEDLTFYEEVDGGKDPATGQPIVTRKLRRYSGFPVEVAGHIIGFISHTAGGKYTGYLDGSGWTSGTLPGRGRDECSRELTGRLCDRAYTAMATFTKHITKGVI